MAGLCNSIVNVAIVAIYIVPFLYCTSHKLSPLPHTLALTLTEQGVHLPAHVLNPRHEYGHWSAVRQCGRRLPDCGPEPGASALHPQPVLRAVSKWCSVVVEWSGVKCVVYGCLYCSFM